MLQYQTENFGKSYEYRSGVHHDWSVAAHIHEFSEIAFVKSGCQTVYVDGKKHRVEENHGIIILPNQIHEYTAETPALVRCLVFSNDFIQAFFVKTAGAKPKHPIADFSEYTQLFDMLEKTRPSDTVQLGGLLCLICDRFLKSSDWSFKASADTGAYHAVIDYISNNYRQDITLKEISEKLGYNEKYLSSALHGLTHMNFRLFLASYRIEFAKQRLLSNDMSVTDIALESGFSSINTFNRIFKQLTGMTPREYRRRSRA